MFQQATFAAFWNKDNSHLGNDIQKEEFPDSVDVEPKRDAAADSLVIKGGVEEVMEVSLEECLRYALGNNPRIQAAMQDVFASDARVRQAWSSNFSFLPSFSNSSWFLARK